MSALLPTDMADAARRALEICDRIGDPRSELAAIHAAGLSVTEIGATELDRLIDEYRTHHEGNLINERERTFARRVVALAGSIGR